MVLVALFGCRDKTPRPDPGPPEPTPANKADAATSVFVPDLVRIALLDSGAAPREPLRYQLRVGDKQIVTLRLRHKATNRLRAAAPTEMIVPAIKLVFHVEVVEAKRGDSVRYRFDLAESALTDLSGADKRLVKTASAMLKTAQGIRGSAVVDSRGIIRDGTIDIPGTVDPSMRVMVDSIRSSMEQLTVPLPAEPVGIGARWELSQTLVQGGTAVEQSTIFELKKRDTGATEIVELVGAIEQIGERQDIPLPGFEYAEMLSLTAKGKSNVTVVAARLAPEKSTTSLRSESQFEFAKKGERRQALVSIGESVIGVSSQ